MASAVPASSGTSFQWEPAFRAAARAGAWWRVRDLDQLTARVRLVKVAGPHGDSGSSGACGNSFFRNRESDGNRIR